MYSPPREEVKRTVKGPGPEAACCVRVPPRDGAGDNGEGRLRGRGTRASACGCRLCGELGPKSGKTVSGSNDKHCWLVPSSFSLIVFLVLPFASVKMRFALVF